MSADPQDPGNPSLTTGGHVIVNMMFTNGNSEANVELIDLLGRDTKATRLADQWTIPPYKEDMPKEHPCFDVNEVLGQCSERQPLDMHLAGRVAMCNDERKVLMKCVAKHKKWEPPAKRWYQIWK